MARFLSLLYHLVDFYEHIVHVGSLPNLIQPFAKVLWAERWRQIAANRAVVIVACKELFQLHNRQRAIG